VRLDSFFRNPETGRIVVAQRPNLPLAAFLAGSVLRRVVGGSPLLDAATTGALVWWAVLEIADGDSPFRRVLGGAVLTGTVASATIAA